MTHNSPFWDHTELDPLSAGTGASVLSGLYESLVFLATLQSDDGVFPFCCAKCQRFSAPLGSILIKEDRKEFSYNTVYCKTINIRGIKIWGF